MQKNLNEISKCNFQLAEENRWTYLSMTEALKGFRNMSCSNSIRKDPGTAKIRKELSLDYHRCKLSFELLHGEYI